MELDGYVSDLRSQLAAAAGAGDDDTRAVAERLSTALDPAARLVLLQVLSDASSEITRELAPGSVEVRLRGRDPELVVSPPTPPRFADPTPVAQAAAAEVASAEVRDTVEDGSTTRTTLRLPDHLKVRVEQAATEDGVSVNAWLVRAVAHALTPGADQDRPRTSNSRTANSRTANNRTSDPGTSNPGSFTGWAR